MKILKDSTIFVLILLPFWLVGHNGIYDLIFISALIIIGLTIFIKKKFIKSKQKEATIEDMEWGIKHIENDSNLSQNEKIELVKQTNEIIKEMKKEKHLTNGSN